MAAVLACTIMPLALIAGCATVEPTTDPPSLDGTAWIAAEVAGETAVADAPTLRFDGGRASGSDGCNRYLARWTAEGAALRFEAPGAGTLMACAPEAMARAAAWRKVLAATASHVRDGGRLELRDSAGQRLALLRVQPTSLAGTRWRVLAVNNGRAAVASVPAGVEVTLAFDATGDRASGSAGCNRFSASATLDGTGLRFGPPSASKRLCGEPAGLMALESEFLAALATVATARREGDQLELRTAAGALALSLARIDE